MAIPNTVRECLENAGLDYEVVRHPYAEGSMRTAEAAHISGERLAKAVLLRDADGYVLAVVPATHHVHVSKVREELGRALETASEDDIRDVFPDCSLGALPALGPAYQLETIVDSALLGHADAWFEAGDHEELIRVAGADFEKLLGDARAFEFSVHAGGV